DRTIRGARARGRREIDATVAGPPAPARVTIHLEVRALDTGTVSTFAPPAGEEGAVVLLAGDVSFDDARASRADVFDARASAVYPPPGSAVDVNAHGRSEVAFVATVDARLPGNGSVVHVGPDDVAVHNRGEPGWQRAVHDVIAESVPARKLIIGETFNEP